MTLPISGHFMVNNWLHILIDCDSILRTKIFCGLIKIFWKCNTVRVCYNCMFSIVNVVMITF